MDLDSLNKKYWSELESEDIMSGVHFPGNELLNLLKDRSNILDVGCGSGKISNFLFNLGHAVTGVDINKDAIEKNKIDNSGIDYFYADVTNNLPLPDQSFDVITVPYVLVSIINDELVKKVIDEIGRVLKNDGLVWICEATYSGDYLERYADGFNKTGLENIALSYKGDEKTFKNREIKRVIKHYSVATLDDLFRGYKKLSSQVIAKKSPSSGMEIQTIVAVYQK